MPIPAFTVYPSRSNPSTFSDDGDTFLSEMAAFIAAANLLEVNVSVAGIPIANAAGTVDAITADYTPDITLSNNRVCLFVASGANTSTTPTFAPDGLTAHTIVKKGSSALAAADIPAAGAVCLVAYNLANTRWELLNPATGSSIAVASIAEVNAGTENGKFISPDALAGSNHGCRVVQIIAFSPTTDVATGDGKVYFVVPTELTGMNLVRVAATVITAGTTNNTDIQIANVTDAVDMLSTKMRIETGETSTRTSAQPGTIDAAHDDVVTGDVLRIDVDAVQTTAPKGLIVELVFQLP